MSLISTCFFFFFLLYYSLIVFTVCSSAACKGLWSIQTSMKSFDWSVISFMCIRFDWINFIVHLGGNVYFLLPSTTKVHTLQRVPPKTRASVTFAWFKWMKFCVFTVFVCGCVRPPGLIAPRRTTIPQRDGIRQPMNEPTKVVSSSSLHSSFKAVTCLILIAEGGDIWQLWFKHMSSSVCVCVCVCVSVNVWALSRRVFLCVCVCQLWGELLLHWLLMRPFVSSQGYRHSAEQQ